MTNEGRIATLDSTIADRLPAFSKTLFDGKAAKDLSFEAIAKHLGRSEVAVAALFYGQATASSEDVEKLSEILDLPKEALAAQLTGFPNRGQAGPMPLLSLSSTACTRSFRTTVMLTRQSSMRSLEMVS
jgi:cyanate lyase